MKKIVFYASTLLLGLTLLSQLAVAQDLTIRQRILMPGPLAEKHAELETNCENCHSPFDREETTALCLDCHDEIAAHELNVCMEEWCWDRAGQKYPKRSLKRDETGRVAELAVLFYLNPEFEFKRKPSQCAAFVQIAPKTWHSKYFSIRSMAIQELAELQSAANRQIHIIMRET